MAAAFAARKRCVPSVLTSTAPCTWRAAAAVPIDEGTKKVVQKIPLLTTRAGPRDGEAWVKRLKEARMRNYAPWTLVRSLSVVLLFCWRCCCCMCGVQELAALIKYIQFNKAADNDWFLIESNKDGTQVRCLLALPAAWAGGETITDTRAFACWQWKGKCWYVYNLVKYEFDVSRRLPTHVHAARAHALCGHGRAHQLGVALG